MSHESYTIRRSFRRLRKFSSSSSFSSSIEPFFDCEDEDDDEDDLVAAPARWGHPALRSWLFVRLVRRLFGCAHSNARLNLWSSLLLGIFLSLMSASAAGLVDVWRADDLNLNDGDTVGTWSSASNRVAGALVGVPIFKRNVT